jgi:hypothetical protein
MGGSTLRRRQREWTWVSRCGLLPWLLGAAALLGAPPPVQACGGCFSQGVGAPVVAHRMAFALSEGRTVLWDQFQYAGPAEDFSWVLPITPGAYLELSTDAWFDALETATAVQVQPPIVPCASRGSGGSGCGADDDVVFAGDSGARTPAPSVSVLRRESVGPYETVTLRSQSGDALTAWLVQNGYLVPEDVVPIIAQYALRSAGVQFFVEHWSPARVGRRGVCGVTGGGAPAPRRTVPWLSQHGEAPRGGIRGPPAPSGWRAWVGSS